VRKKLADIFDEKTMASIARLFGRINEDYKIDEAYLFGSHADGTQKEKSDIDLAMVHGFHMFAEDKHNCHLRALACNHKIHLQTYSREEFDNPKDGYVSVVVKSIKEGIPIDVAKVLDLPKLKKPATINHGKTKTD